MSDAVQKILKAYHKKYFVKDLKGIGSRFEELLKKRFEVNNLNDVTEPTKKMWLDFALSTVDRGTYVKNIISEYCKIKNKRYLDVGCGYGGFLLAFSRAGASEAIGIDISSDLLGYCKALADDSAHELKAYNKSIISKEDVESLGKFDIITCNDVIEHVESANIAMSHLSSMLNNNGLLYLEIPNRFYPNFIKADGHFKLFGITLLPKWLADKYFKNFFASMENDVTYESLNRYMNRLINLGLNCSVINPLFDHKEVELEQIRNGLADCKKEAIALSSEFPPAFRNAINTRVSKIVTSFDKKYELYHGLKKTKPEDAQQIADRLILTFGVDFWRIIAWKKGF